MKLIGLTGTTGSGKGYASACFMREGIESIDTDAIVHRLYREDEACINELENAFGAIRREDGSVDRKRLAAIVFSDGKHLARLNQIVHKYVWREVERISKEKERTGTQYLILDAPLLYEAGMEKLCDCVIAVTAPESLRIQRICIRDGIDEIAAEQRIHNQHEDSFFVKNADYVILNDGRESVEVQVKRIIGELNNG